MRTWPSLALPGVPAWMYSPTDILLNSVFLYAWSRTRPAKESTEKGATWPYKPTTMRPRGTPLVAAHDATLPPPPPSDRSLGVAGSQSETSKNTRCVTTGSVVATAAHARPAVASEHVRTASSRRHQVACKGCSAADWASQAGRQRRVCARRDDTRNGSCSCGSADSMTLCDSQLSDATTDAARRPDVHVALHSSALPEAAFSLTQG